MLCQQNPADFAQGEQHRINGMKHTPVTWILQFQQIPPIANMGIQAQEPFYMELCYDFRFAGHKAAEVGPVMQNIAHQSRLEGRNRSMDGQSTLADLLRHRNRCVSHVCPLRKAGLRVTKKADF